MTNTLELKVAMLLANFTINDVATALGLSYYGFHKKLTNKAEFKANEILKISNLLKLNLEEKEKIFFANVVAETDTTDNNKTYPYI